MLQLLRVGGGLTLSYDAETPLGASGHCPRNAAFMRQARVKGHLCRINAAFRYTAGPNSGAVPGCARRGSAQKTPLALPVVAGVVLAVLSLL